MATAIFSERDLKTAVAALDAATERVKANAAAAVDMQRSEKDRMWAATRAAEDAIQASKAAARVTGYAHYLAGFLSGAGVPDTADACPGCGRLNVTPGAHRRVGGGPCPNGGV